VIFQLSGHGSSTNQNLVRRSLLPVVVENFTLNLSARAEVEKQADLNFRRFQVIEQLSFMAYRQRLGCFYFNDDLVINQHVGDIFTYHTTIITNLYRTLRPRSQSRLHQLNHEGVFIDLFQKTISKFIVNVIETTENAVS